jgi:hypothetical protein
MGFEGFCSRALWLFLYWDEGLEVGKKYKTYYD